MPPDNTDYKSTLVQVMDCFRQPTIAFVTNVD